MTNKKALITGITGQDGAYLAEFLLSKDYEVHGIKRRTSLFNTARIDHLYQDPHDNGRRFFLHHGDMTDSSSLLRIIQQVQPYEVYNLAAQSHVAVSFETRWEVLYASMVEGWLAGEKNPETSNVRGVQQSGLQAHPQAP